MDGDISRAIIGFHKPEYGAVLCVRSYRKGELTRRGNLWATLQRGLAHHIAGIFAGQGVGTDDQRSVSLERMHLTVGLVTDDEALARLLGGGGHRLIDLLRFGRH